MPYIAGKITRGSLDKIVDEMGIELAINGDLNYLLFAYCKRHVEPSYQNYRNFFAEINESVHEMRRRFLVPYEKSKIEINGDVETQS